jgi:hypothetical protein
MGDGREAEKSLPQGLKPALILRHFGTTEVVP